jgi:hypothetical protein
MLRMSVSEPIPQVPIRRLAQTLSGDGQPSTSGRLLRQIDGNSDGTTRHSSGGGNLLSSRCDHITELLDGCFFDCLLSQRLELKRRRVNLEFF